MKVEGLTDFIVPLVIGISIVVLVWIVFIIVGAAVKSEDVNSKDNF